MRRDRLIGILSSVPHPYFTAHGRYVSLFDALFGFIGPVWVFNMLFLNMCTARKKMSTTTAHKNKSESLFGSEFVVLHTYGPYMSE